MRPDTFTGTGCIHQDTIEQVLCFVAEIARLVMRDYGVAVAPFLDVLRKDEHALAHHFVGYKQSLVAEELAD